MNILDFDFFGLKFFKFHAKKTPGLVLEPCLENHDRATHSYKLQYENLPAKFKHPILCAAASVKPWAPSGQLKCVGAFDL